mmetsp:Transcript_128134/g.362767  ORF Transcript_128134/g.362767 Transcript_128134/m.362767 type:complete len:144 (+) Transcript_128134:70-501(+)
MGPGNTGLVAAEYARAQAGIPECAWAHVAKHEYANEGCYAAMGLAFGVAKCWAKADTAVRACERSCLLDQFNSEACIACRGEARQSRWGCTFKYMGITQTCQGCILDSYKFEDINCRMQCNLAGPHCGQCRSMVANMISTCLA